jgi:hypothetical protein
MKTTLFLFVVLMAGCGTPSGLMTSPGAELPAGLDWCERADEIGRCAKWHVGSGKIRPYDTAPVLVEKQP